MTNESETTAILERSTGVTNPLVLIQAAIERGIPPDQLGKLLDLQERWERNQAEHAYTTALAAFQAECPMIEKTRAVIGNDKVVKFKYANFEDIWAIAGPICARHKIGVSFDTEEMESKTRIICFTQVSICTRQSSVPIPTPPKVGMANDTQLAIQAISYGKRIALCNALNIVVRDEDKDGEGLHDFISPDERRALNDLIVEKEVDAPAFFRWLSAKAGITIESLDHVPRKHFREALTTLQRRAAGPKEAKVDGKAGQPAGKA